MTDLNTFQWRYYPKFAEMFLLPDDLNAEQQLEILEEVVKILSEREQAENTDARVL